MSSIAALRARAVHVPMTRPLHTSTGAIDKVPLVLIDLTSSSGAIGRSYLFSVTPMALKAQVAMLDAMAPLLLGQPLHPHDLGQMLQRRFTLLGTRGLVGMALSGIDMAAWDACAIEAGLPLAGLLGAQIRPVKAYNSCGLGLRPEPCDWDALAREAQDLAQGGFSAVKLRLGYARLEQDVMAFKAVRAALPAHVQIMSDYNQGLLPAEAIRRGQVLDDLGLQWIEEPVHADDHAGCARVAAALRTPVQIGENYWGPQDMARAISAQASDYVMPDLERIGGVSGWMRAAALAEAAALPMSTHLFPEASAHLMCATPTAHWLEYVDWANPVLQQPIGIRDGHVLPNETPGSGIEWDEQQVKAYAF